MMSGAGARVLVNLAALRRGGAVTHLSGFLPELVALRSRDRFEAVVPAETADLVSSWGLHTTVHRHPPGSPALRLLLDQGLTRRAARRSDLLLSPLNHGPIGAPVPHLLWACNVLHFRRSTDPRSAVNGWFARAAAGRADLVVYPTASARLEAERSGVGAPGLIMRHPLRIDGPPPRRGATQTAEGTLRVLVPSSNQPHKNLALLSRTSAELAKRGVHHHFDVTADLPADLISPTVSGGTRYDQDTMGALLDQFDVVFIPSVAESYSYPLVEFERLGMPVAASGIEPHVELHDRAHLFDPASPSGAADALVAAAASGPMVRVGTGDDWRFARPSEYAASVSAEMDRLLRDARR